MVGRRKQRERDNIYHQLRQETVLLSLLYALIVGLVFHDGVGGQLHDAC